MGLGKVPRRHERRRGSKLPPPRARLGGVARPVRMYSTLICPYCLRAKALLKLRGIAYDDVDVTGDAEARAWLVQTTGRRTVPQIFIGEEPIGGFDELRELDRTGELTKKLAA
ncbi:MAG: glutaredoxin 3 [Labilithrix sp.]|nr:glutaredoxin 3 [Labilithrix sp.]